MERPLIIIYRVQVTELTIKSLGFIQKNPPEIISVFKPRWAAGDNDDLAVRVYGNNKPRTGRWSVTNKWLLLLPGRWLPCAAACFPHFLYIYIKDVSIWDFLCHFFSRLCSAHWPSRVACCEQDPQRVVLDVHNPR